MARNTIAWVIRPAILVAGLLVVSGVALAGAGQGPIDPTMHASDDAYLNRQAAALLREVSATLAAHPPGLPEPRERWLALLLLDAVLHEKYAPNRPAVQAFYQERIAAAVAEMEQTEVTAGARLWKLYNHGFVLRTPSVTLGFDLHPGPEGFRVNDPEKGRTLVPSPGFPISQALRERLVRQCDALFISHKHGDHASASIAELFLEQGKVVVAPPEVFAGGPLEERLTRLRREAHVVQELALGGERPVLKLVVYPGQQYQGSGVPNNVVLVYTPEGLRVAHNGDQINDPYPAYQEDFVWSDRVHEHHEVDVLITNCWSNDLLRFVRGFRPKLVFTGHENELSHPLWDRVPFWGDEEYLELNLSAVKDAFPTYVLTWGESVEIALAEE